MKTYTEITILAQPERTVLEAISLNCDLCSREIKQFGKNGMTMLNPKFRERFGTAFDVRVELCAGEENLDGGAGETTRFDLCPECFEERLRPWLEQQGAVARVEAW